MILSAAIARGSISKRLVAIVTSGISGVNYLSSIKEVFFDKQKYRLNVLLKPYNADRLTTKNSTRIAKLHIKMKNVVISSSLSLSISVVTLIITSFIFRPEELLSLANILAYIIFNL